MRESIVSDARWAIDRLPYEEPALDACAGWKEKVCAPRLFSILNRVAEGGQRFHHAV